MRVRWSTTRVCALGVYLRCRNRNSSSSRGSRMMMTSVGRQRLSTKGVHKRRTRAPSISRGRRVHTVVLSIIDRLMFVVGCRISRRQVTLLRNGITHLSLRHVVRVIVSLCGVPLHRIVLSPLSASHPLHNSREYTYVPRHTQEISLTEYECVFDS